MMKLQLEVTHVDHATHRVSFKTLNPAPTYQLSKRAAESFEVGQASDAVIQLPDQYPIGPIDIRAQVAEQARDFHKNDLEMKEIDAKWYRRSPDYPHNWEPIQSDIEKAIERVLRTGQPQVLPRCGYVSDHREFIPYRLAQEKSVDTPAIQSYLIAQFLATFGAASYPADTIAANLERVADAVQFGGQLPQLDRAQDTACAIRTLALQIQRHERSV